MFRYMKTAFCLSLLILTALAVPKYSAITAHIEKFVPRNTIVIDAGHGGMDSGAVSKSGLPEKDINLAIAFEIKRLAESDGFRVIMTRSEDKLLGSGTGSIRSRKTADLKARREIIDKEMPLFALSIHLNSFREDPRVRGAQVFYPQESTERAVLERSEFLAKTVQRELERGMGGGKERSALGKGDVRILQAPVVPTIIVECGFLSNKSEAEKLSGCEYQLKLANLIYNGIMNYMRDISPKTVGIIDSVYSISGVKINRKQSVDN